MIRRILFLLIFLGTVSLLCWGAWHFFFRESDELMIRREFAELIRHMENGFSRNGNIFDRIELAKKTSGYFTEISTFDLPGLKQAKMSRENIVSNMMMLQKFMKKLTLSMEDLTLSFNREHTQCRALFSIMAVGTSNSGSSFREVYELDAHLVRNGKKWLIEKTSFQNVLKR